MFVAAGWPVSSPLGLPTDIFDSTDVTRSRILDERTEADGPFCLVLDCGEWDDNLVTTWIVELVSTRVQRGRVVLLRWARHHGALPSGYANSAME